MGPDADTYTYRLTDFEGEFGWEAIGLIGGFGAARAWVSESGWSVIQSTGMGDSVELFMVSPTGERTGQLLISDTFKIRFVRSLSPRLLFEELPDSTGSLQWNPNFVFYWLEWQHVLHLVILTAAGERVALTPAAGRARVDFPADMVSRCAARELRYALGRLKEADGEAPAALGIVLRARRTDCKELLLRFPRSAGRPRTLSFLSEEEAHYTAEESLRRLTLAWLHPELLHDDPASLGPLGTRPSVVPPDCTWEQVFQQLGPPEIRQGYYEPDDGPITPEIVGDIWNYLLFVDGALTLASITWEPGSMGMRQRSCTQRVLTESDVDDLASSMLSGFFAKRAPRIELFLP